MTAAAPTLKGDCDINFLENPDLLDIINELSHSIKSESQVRMMAKPSEKLATSLEALHEAVTGRPIRRCGKAEMLHAVSSISGAAQTTHSKGLNTFTPVF